MAFPYRTAPLKRILRLLLISLGCYALACAALVFSERHLLYVPFPGPVDPALAGLPSYSRATFASPDGLTIPYWEHATETGPILLYFHGNGGGLHAFAEPLAWFAAQDLHVIAMEYRGYPGAPGIPSERALVGDATALFDAIRQRYPGRSVMAWGYSLGSGVATQLAAQRPVARLVLEAPFSATVDRAQQLFPLFPVGQLMRDQFLSREHIRGVHAPLLILHGTDDLLIPIALGEALYAQANPPKQFRRYPGADHYTLIDTSAYRDALAFLRTP